jgi:methionyl-tRNA formyltransferase
MSPSYSVLFFGSSEFSTPTLRALAAGPHEVRAVYTRPDRPGGRGRKLRPTPVALAARELGLPVETPARVRDAAVVDGMRALQPDAVVLAAYGAIIPPAALEVPRLGWLNVHPSLLPQHRGASPVVSSILAGDAETGVCVFLMGAGLDDGPVLAEERTPIGEEETAGELEARLAEIGARLLPPTLEGWAAGRLEARPQDEARSSYAPKLTREAARLRWTEPAATLGRKVRAYNPWPVSHALWAGGPLRVLRARPIATEPRREPGVVFTSPEMRNPLVACGEGALELVEVQPAGSRAMPGRAFLAGHPGFADARLA